MTNKKISSSPAPSKIVMDFPAAMAKVIDKAKISKLEWKDTGIYGFLKEKWLMIHKADGDHQWLISEGDLIGKDYIVV